MTRACAFGIQTIEFKLYYFISIDVIANLFLYLDRSSQFILYFKIKEVECNTSKGMQY